MNTPPLHRSRVLVVEDNAETLAWICETLKDGFEGVEYVAASTFASAEALLLGPAGARQAFDIALLDIVLPDGNGIDLIRQISAQLPATLPIVITIFDDDATLFDALAAGAMGYILKAVQTPQLIEQLARIDRNEPPISPSIAHRLLAYFRTASVQARPDSANASDHHLTNREIEVLRLLGKGLTAGEIAGILGMSHNTCVTHVKAIYRKLNISSRAEAAIEADRRGLV